MFGYLKPYTPELKLREYEVYRAIYCGLCRSMGNLTGQFSRMTLSYDFVFLAACRILLTDEAVNISKRRCAAHPLKKKLSADDCEALRFTACASAYLCEGKILDDISDERYLRRLRALLLTPAAKYFSARASRHTLSTDIRDVTERGLAAQCEADHIENPSPDISADAFGNLCGELFAIGLDGAAERIAREVGFGTGRFIYLADAAHDIIEDMSLGRFNPLLSLYGEDAVESTKNGKALRRETADEIMTAAVLELEPLTKATELMCECKDRTISEIVKNTVYLGMPEAMKNCLDHSCRGAYRTEKDSIQ